MKKQNIILLLQQVTALGEKKTKTVLFFKKIKNLKVEMKPTSLAKASSLQRVQESAIATATGQQRIALAVRLLEHRVSVRLLQSPPSGVMTLRPSICC